MRSSRRRAHGDSGIGIVLLLLALLLWGRGAPAVEQYAVDCVFCHTLPPGDSADRQPLAGSLAGNHGTHAQSVADSCVKCHGATSGNSHRDGKIQISDNVNGSPAAGAYSRGREFPQSSVPTPGTCSNVNCHFERSTPTWGSATLGAPDATACGTCHAALPSTDSHGKHLARYGDGLPACNRCHPDYTAAGTPYDHANAVGRAISVTVPYTGASGSYLPSQSGRVLGTCSTVACHSPGQGATGGALAAEDYAAPRWGVASSGACGTCHKATKATLTSGSHEKHLNAAGSAGCGDCHDGALGDGASYASANHVNTLIDVSEGRGYTKGGAPGNGYGTCATAVCHDSGTGTPTVSPTWGSAAASCAACHALEPTTGSHTAHVTAARAGCGDCHAGAVKGTTAPPTHLNALVDVNRTGEELGYPSPKAKGSPYDTCMATCHDDGTGILVETAVWGTNLPSCTQCHTSRPATGGHGAHLERVVGTTCATCHAGTTEGSTAPSGHLNATIDVDAALGYPQAKAKGSAYASCSTAACHHTGLVGGQKVSDTWGSASGDRCGACHDSRPATGSHAAHANNGASCASCHKGAVYGVTAPVEHVDGNVDVYATTVNDLGYGANRAYGAAASRCTTSSCHNDGRGNTVASPAWGTQTADCAACHEKRPSSGAHSPHLTVGLTCGNCHKGAVEGGVAPLQHLDGNVDVYKVNAGDLGYPPNKGIGSAPVACSTSGCHGTLSPVWGAVTTNHQCTKCHGEGVAPESYDVTLNLQSAPGYDGVGVSTGRVTGTLAGNVSDNPKVGAHDTHLRSLDNVGKPAVCRDCHTVPAAVFVAGHMNGTADLTWSNLVKNRETTPGSNTPYTFGDGVLTPAYANGQCSNTYCHGATLPGGTNKTPSWTDGTYIAGVYDGVGAENRAHDCAVCHGYPPSTAEGSRMPHDPPADHMVCSDCHPHNGTRDSTDPLLDPDFHMNGRLEATNHCDTCHDYDTRGTNGAVWGRNPLSVEGFGVHAMHINYLKLRMGVTALNPNADAYGQGATAAVCGVCHSNLPANHQQTDRSALRQITFGESTARQFGPNPPVYNGLTGASSADTPKTCSNLDCHYKTSPIWQPF